VVQGVVRPAPSLLPASQFWQTPEVEAPTMVLYLPAAQLTQRPPEEENFPATHNTQAAEDVDMTKVAVDFPAGQDRQVAMEVAPAEALHLPALQGTQSPPAVE